MQSGPATSARVGALRGRSAALQRRGRSQFNGKTPRPPGARPLGRPSAKPLPVRGPAPRVTFRAGPAPPLPEGHRGAFHPPRRLHAEAPPEPSRAPTPSSPPGAPRPPPPAPDLLCQPRPLPPARRGAACAASPPHGPARHRASPPRTAASRPPRSGRRTRDPRRPPRCPAAAAPAPRTPGLRLRLLPPGPAPVSHRHPLPASGARGIASGARAELERSNPALGGGGKEPRATPRVECTAHGDGGGGGQRPPADGRWLRRSRTLREVLALRFTEIAPNSDPSPPARRQGREPGGHTETPGGGEGFGHRRISPRPHRYRNGTNPSPCTHLS